mmetsp:Transcript_18633/g.25665  ORF Transcript_18633/g.25665 Transcript_18633/m.25665 type:complete len:178 (-) Transcript_18633:368-901(-)
MRCGPCGDPKCHKIQHRITFAIAISRYPYVTHLSIPYTLRERKMNGHKKTMEYSHDDGAHDDQSEADASSETSQESANPTRVQQELENENRTAFLLRILNNALEICDSDGEPVQTDSVSCATSPRHSAASPGLLCSFLRARSPYQGNSQHPTSERRRCSERRGSGNNGEDKDTDSTN